MNTFVYRSIISVLLVGIVIVLLLVGHDMGYVDFDILGYFKGILNYE